MITRPKRNPPGWRATAGLPEPGRAHMRLRSAFTIPEALTGLVIVGVMFTSLYGGISFSVASTRIARENLRAAQILTEKMEVVRLCTWEQINSNGFLPAKFTAPYEPGGPTNGSALVYKGTIKVRPPPSGFLPDQYTNAMRLIDVTVSWNSGGVDRDRETHTFVSAYGLQNYIIKPK